jgi:hypothetical protein
MVDDIDFDQKSIDSLREAAKRIASASRLLKSNEHIFEGTNLSVADAVIHVLACLEKDAAYLNRLAEICVESAPAMKKLTGA